MLTRRAEVQRWLDQLRLEASLDKFEDKELDALAEALGSAPLAAALKLQLQAQQQWRIQLSQVSLHDPRNVSLASVLQGQIKAVDLICETLLQALPDTQVDASQPAN